MLFYLRDKMIRFTLSFPLNWLFFIVFRSLLLLKRADTKDFRFKSPISISLFCFELIFPIFLISLTFNKTTSNFYDCMSLTRLVLHTREKVNCFAFFLKHPWRKKFKWLHLSQKNTRFQNFESSTCRKEYDNCVVLHKIQFVHWFFWKENERAKWNISYETLIVT